MEQLSFVFEWGTIVDNITNYFISTDFNKLFTKRYIMMAFQISIFNEAIQLPRSFDVMGNQITFKNLQFRMPSKEKDPFVIGIEI